MSRSGAHYNWVDQVEVPQYHWKLKRFSTVPKMESVLEEPNLENNLARERMTTRTKQLEEEKTFRGNVNIDSNNDTRLPNRKEPTQTQRWRLSKT